MPKNSTLPRIGTAARVALNEQIVVTCRMMWNLALEGMPPIPDHSWSTIDHDFTWFGGDPLLSTHSGFGPHLRLTHEGFLRRADTPNADAAKFPDQVRAEIRMFIDALVKPDPVAGYEYGAILFVTEGSQIAGQSRDLVITSANERHFSGSDPSTVARAVGSVAAKVLQRRTVALSPVLCPA